MKYRVLWITRTAVMLALLIALQGATKGLGQLVTGSCVNAILALSVLLCGMGSGMTVALLSPIFAFLLGIAPNIVTVPAIMAGNGVFVALLGLLYRKTPWRQVTAWLAAAAAKFAALYLLVVQVVCGLAADALLAQGILKSPMLKALPATFTWPQLFTALIGGGAALLMLPVLQKALKRT